MIKRGQYKIVRVDGTETVINEAPTIDSVHKAIGCDCIDTVIVTKDIYDMAETVMLVDDTGMLTNKPINKRATALMEVLYKPPYNPIHGDVVLCNDKDFGNG